MRLITNLSTYVTLHSMLRTLAGRLVPMSLTIKPYGGTMSVSFTTLVPLRKDSYVLTTEIRARAGGRLNCASNCQVNQLHMWAIL